MSDRLSDALQQALESVARGSTVDQALAPYPDLTSELRPLLEAALAATGLAPREVPLAALARSRRRALARAAGLKAAAPRPARLSLLPRFALAVAALVIILGLGLDGISTAAAIAPGRRPLSVKIVSEELQLRSNHPDDRRTLSSVFPTPG
jgi:hypothetical protein